MAKTHRSSPSAAGHRARDPLQVKPNVATGSVATGSVAGAWTGTVVAAAIRSMAIGPEASQSVATGTGVADPGAADTTAGITGDAMASDVATSSVAKPPVATSSVATSGPATARPGMVRGVVHETTSEAAIERLRLDEQAREDLAEQDNSAHDSAHDIADTDLADFGMSAEFDSAGAVGGGDQGAVAGSALDAARAAFEWLTRGPHPVCVDGRRFSGLPTRLVPLDELTDLLLSRDCGQGTRDAVWAHLVARSRAEGGTWTLACVGVALPALIAVAAQICAPFVGDTHDLDAAIVSGFLDQLRTVDLRRPRIVTRLRWAAFRAGMRAVREALDAPTPRAPQPSSTPPPAPFGHPDLVLARAVAAGAITSYGAWLIGATRLEHLSLGEAAAQLGSSYDAVQHARRRAERDLLAWLRAPQPSDAAPTNDPVGDLATDLATDLGTDATTGPATDEAANPAADVTDLADVPGYVPRGSRRVPGARVPRQRRGAPATRTATGHGGAGRAARTPTARAASRPRRKKSAASMSENGPISGVGGCRKPLPTPSHVSEARRCA